MNDDGSLLMVLILITILLLVGKSSEDKVATVNINKIVDHYIESTAKSQIDDEILKKNTKLFILKLEKEMSDLAKEKKVTLLVSEAVIAGAVDYTEDIQKRTENFDQEPVNEK